MNVKHFFKTYLRKLDKAPPMADECMFIGPLGLGCVVLKESRSNQTGLC